MKDKGLFTKDAHFILKAPPGLIPEKTQRQPALCQGKPSLLSPLDLLCLCRSKRVSSKKDPPLRRPHQLRGLCDPPHQLFTIPSYPRSYFTWECRNFGAKWRKNAPHPISFLSRRYFHLFPSKIKWVYLFLKLFVPFLGLFVSFSLTLCLIHGEKAKITVLDLPRHFVWEKELLLYFQYQKSVWS